ncbi:MAG: MarR family transcriptional regulator [Chloroflexota bacterium]
MSTTIDESVGGGRRVDGPSVDEVVDGLGPMMAYQRGAMMRAWQDRSLSKLNLHVLMLLGHEGPVTMTRLATLVDVSLSNMTGIVDRLEQHGLVERVRDDRDRRLVLVRATPAGASRCEEADGLRTEHLRRLIGALDGRERAVVLEAAQALARGVARLDATEHADHTDA